MLAMSRNLTWSKLKRFHNSMLPKCWNSTSVPAPHQSQNLKSSAPEVTRKYIKKGPGLEYFLYNSAKPSEEKKDVINHNKIPYINDEILDGTGKKGNL